MLGIGRLVFRALNSLLAGSNGAGAVVAASVAVVVLAVEWLLTGVLFVAAA